MGLCVCHPSANISVKSVPGITGQGGCIKVKFLMNIVGSAVTTANMPSNDWRTIRSGPGANPAATKPGTLLKHPLPVRTGHWDITRPGFIEADTVAHGASSLAGNFVWSLVLTDIFSGWTQLRAVWNKGAAGSQEQIADWERQTPFARAGFDCDNGSEFLNDPWLHDFTRREAPVAFTRSRPHHP